jgi:hypothetical protein
MKPWRHENGVDKKTNCAGSPRVMIFTLLPFVRMASLGTPTWSWSVAVDGALYVRACHGPKSRWYRAALRQRAGRISAAGTTRDVTFMPVEGPINDLIDDAYRAKYGGSPYLSSMISARSRNATMKVMPRDRDHSSKETRV